MDRIFDRNEFALIKQTFDKLLKQFFIVYSYPNNSSHTTVQDGIEVPTVLNYIFARPGGRQAAIIIWTTHAWPTEFK